MSAILEQPDDTGAFHLVAFESHKLTPIARTLLGLLAVVHALKALRPYLLHKPFELHTDNASLQWLQQLQLQHHVIIWRVGSTCWPNTSTSSCTTRSCHSGRLPYPEALPRCPGPGAAHGLRRAGFGAWAIHRFSRGPRFRLRGRWPRCRVASLSARRLRGRGSRGPPVRPGSGALGADGTGADPPCGLSVALRLRLPRRAAPPPQPAQLSPFAYLRRARFARRRCVSSTRQCGGTARRALGSRLDARPDAPVEEYLRACPTSLRVKADRLPPAGLLYPPRSPRAAAGVSAWAARPPLRPTQMTVALDVGAARHGGHAPRRRLLRSLAGPSRVCLGFGCLCLGFGGVQLSAGAH